MVASRPPSPAREENPTRAPEGGTSAVKPIDNDGDSNSGDDPNIVSNNSMDKFLLKRVNKSVKNQINERKESARRDPVPDKGKARDP